MTQHSSEAVIAAFVEVARPIILQLHGGLRADCIAATHITMLVMERFGLQAVAQPCRMYVECKELQLAYIVGATEEERKRAQRTAASLNEVPGRGWSRHLVAVVEGRWWIDPTFDQAQAPDHGLVIEPCIFCFDSQGLIEQPDWWIDGHIRVAATTDEGQQLSITYISAEDNSYRETPAWETDHITLTVEFVARTMEAWLAQKAA